MQSHKSDITNNTRVMLLNDITFTALRRAAPTVYVIDAALRVSMKSVGASACSLELPPAFVEVIRELIDQVTMSAECASTIIDDYVVGVSQAVVPTGSYVVTIEPVRRRAPLATATERYGLTARESEVVFFLLRGYTASAIARNLGIAELTVNDHVKHVAKKIGVSSRLQIVASVLRYNHLDDCPRDFDGGAQVLLS